MVYNLCHLANPTPLFVSGNYPISSWSNTLIIVFAHADVTTPVGPPYWIITSGLVILLPCKLVKFSFFIYKPPERHFRLGFWLFTWNIQLFVFTMKTKKNIMCKPQKTMSIMADLTGERWINLESCTPEREITLADLKEKQCRGNTL